MKTRRKYFSPKEYAEAVYASRRRGHKVYALGSHRTKKRAYFVGTPDEWSKLAAHLWGHDYFITVKVKS